MWGLASQPRVAFHILLLVFAGGARTLRVLLSFAVGCLLADVFLHLLPEVWKEQHQAPAGESLVAYSPECTVAGVSKLFRHAGHMSSITGLGPDNLNTDILYITNDQLL